MDRYYSLSTKRKKKQEVAIKELLPYIKVRDVLDVRLKQNVSREITVKPQWKSDRKSYMFRKK